MTRFEDIITTEDQADVIAAQLSITDKLLAGGVVALMTKQLIVESITPWEKEIGREQYDAGERDEALEAKFNPSCPCGLPWSNCAGMSCLEG